MKIKINKTKMIAMMLIIALFMPNITLAAATRTYTRNDGEKISNIASIKTDDTWIDAKYHAESLPVTQSQVHVYDYETTNVKEISDSEVTYSEDNKSKYSLFSSPNAVTSNPNLFPNSDSELIYYRVNFENGENEYNNVATFLYEDAIKYNNSVYNLKLNIKSVKIKSEESLCGVMVLLGSRQKADDNKLDLSTYTRQEVYPFIHAVPADGKFDAESGDWMEVELEYYIVDDEENQIPVSGVFGINDIDYNQGFYLDGIKPNNTEEEKATNIYINNDEDSTNDEVMYKTLEEGTYIYSSTKENRTDDLHDVYVLIEDKSKITLNYTFDDWAAGSPVMFSNDINHFYKITTSVTGGTITSTVSDIKNGEDRTIEFAPNSSDTQYLKSIKIDGEEQTITGNEYAYNFLGIVKDHSIEVVYENKPAVSFNPMGGAPIPDTQYVMPGEKGTEPTTEPTKEGYTFEEWQNPDGTTAYDFDTPVNEDIELKAKWEPIVYNITYVLDGGINDEDNPSTYTVEDTIDFKNPTKEGYIFKGWFEDENLLVEKDGISNETGDVTVYAKWEIDDSEQGSGENDGDEDSKVKYKVEHYKENSDGTYDLVVTDELTEEVDKEVTAIAKEYTGYTENKIHEERKSSGTVTADGSLVLRLYYDRINYVVAFNPQGGTPTPETQIVKYQDKATEPTTNPTKNGYTFKYWYYINDNNQEVRYNFDDPVVSNIELQAKWEKNVTPETNNNGDKGNSNNSGKYESTSGKVDPSTANKILPYTGTVKNIIMIFMVAAALFGIRYFRLKNLLK